MTGGGGGRPTGRPRLPLTLLPMAVGGRGILRRRRAFNHPSTLPETPPLAPSLPPSHLPPEMSQNAPTHTRSPHSSFLWSGRRVGLFRRLPSTPWVVRGQRVPVRVPTFKVCSGTRLPENQGLLTPSRDGPWSWSKCQMSFVSRGPRRSTTVVSVGPNPPGPLLLPAPFAPTVPSHRTCSLLVAGELGG